MRVEELVRYVGATLPGLMLSMQMGINKRTDVFQIKIEGGVENLKQYPEHRPAELNLLLNSIYMKFAPVTTMKTKCITNLRTFIEKQRLRCLTDTDDISYFGYAMIDVYTASKEIRRGNKKEETRKVMQHRTFKRLLRDEETTPYHAIPVQLQQAINSQKQLIKEYLEEKIGSLFQAIGNDLKRLGVEQASLNHSEDREVRESIGRTLSKAKEDLGTIEALLKESGVDCDGIKDQLT
ncbi:hypothetical protein J4E93_008121 [Alternaria ventricosa]|uniref:uncharacterized protein n=1 Tax=Alternaria ventricosa TaxID=1187951 RepID=UPI0020C4050C|nr:uncharacterized protein J4E93_008121 [Alternaria ventricosa]KAI4641242.1 hypothetical protein J4E93_008121 [Alternaria ventricosa]